MSGCDRRRQRGRRRGRQRRRCGRATRLCAPCRGQEDGRGCWRRLRGASASARPEKAAEPAPEVVRARRDGLLLLFEALQAQLLRSLRCCSQQWRDGRETPLHRHAPHAGRLDFRKPVMRGRVAQPHRRRTPKAQQRWSLPRFQLVLQPCRAQRPALVVSGRTPCRTRLDDGDIVRTGEAASSRFLLHHADFIRRNQTAFRQKKTWVGYPKASLP